jgi:hypothetical protein
MDFSKRVISEDSPCQECKHKYKCDEQRLACTQFRFFVNTGRMPQSIHKEPTRAIYFDVFYREPVMTPKKAANGTYH